MKRHLPTGLSIAKNTADILTAINNHATFADVNKPNQTDPKYITYDISCNEDFALHYKYHEWEKIFEFFRTHHIAKGTFATKTVPKAFLSYNPEKKIRIRFSLMPDRLSKLIEPKTSPIQERIEAINTFIEAGYDVHVNFSPVVFYMGWLDDYIKLFKQLDYEVDDGYKADVLAEVIFLTHNKFKHQYNLKHKLKGEEFLWVPSLQEDKVSEYGGNNIRYKREFKRSFIDSFREHHYEIIPWNRIRYIF